MLASKPRRGDRIGWPDDAGTVRYAGAVAAIDGNLCWLLYPDGEQTPFIWQHRDGLNRLATVMPHDQDA